jgi:DNA repair protein RadC
MRSKNDWVCETLQASYTPKNKHLHILDSVEAAKTLYSIWDKPTFATNEQFYAIYLDLRYKVVGYSVVNTGDNHSVGVDLSFLFKHAWMRNAKRIILAHNHPNGTLEPSDADKRVTESIKNLAKYHHLWLFDHLILAGGDFYSFNDQNNSQINLVV